MVVKVVVEIPDSVMRKLKKQGIDEQILKKDLERVARVINHVNPSRIRR